MRQRDARDLALLKRTVQWRGLLERSLPRHTPSAARKLALSIVEGLVFLKLAQSCKLEPARGVSGLLAGTSASDNLLAAFALARIRYHSAVFDITTLRASPRFERKLRSVVGKIATARLASVAPSMLGRIYESDAAGTRKGVFFTPDFISDYLVSRTLQPLLLQRKSPVVLDPACGAGAFPLRMFAHILRARPPNLTLRQKQRVLLASVHGVDIDAFGVEVAKLSLLLALHAGASRRANSVPDLSSNIRCANSLDAGNRAIFDAVIVNPPFVNIRELKRAESRDLARRFSSARGPCDLYVVFLEQGLRVLKPGGRLGSIVPSTWTHLRYAENCRRMLLAGTRIESITDISPLCSFSKTDTYPYILVCDNAPSERAHAIEVFEVFSRADLKPGKRPTRLVQRALDARAGIQLYAD